MDSKKLVLRIAGGTLGLIILWVAFGAAMIGREASQLDEMLKKAVAAHSPVNKVQADAQAIGIELMPSGNGLEGRGPDHWAFVYRTWLTIKVTGASDAGVNTYHIDRMGSLF